MRADGKKIKNDDPIYTVAAYVMNKRYDAQNMIELDIPIAPMQKYLRAKREEGITISHLALVLAAYLRTAAEFPKLNRFIVNKKIYARKEFAVGMVVMKPGHTDGTINKMYFDYEDDIFTVQQKLIDYIEQNRQDGDVNKTDNIVSTLLRIPGLVNFGVGVFKIMDRYGLLPKKIIDASPFHTSLVISNLASIRTNHIFHHVYDFGTTSIIITMGNLRERPRRCGDEVIFERCIPLGVVMDERICTGGYFAQAFARIRQYLNNPWLLEGEPKVVNKEA